MHFIDEIAPKPCRIETDLHDNDGADALYGAAAMCNMFEITKFSFRWFRLE